MTKTPEQLAEEFAKGIAQRDISMRGTSYREESCLRIGFLAGYKAATDKRLEQIRHLEMELQQAKLSAMKLEAER